MPCDALAIVTSASRRTRGGASGAVALVLALVPTIVSGTVGPRTIDASVNAAVADTASTAHRLSLRTRPNAPTHAVPTDSSDAAETVFSEGEAAYERGDFDIAADRFAKAQAMAPHPATLYNLGMAQHRAGDCLAAYGTFERLGKVATTAVERAEARTAQQLVRRELSAVVVVVSPDVTVCFDDASLTGRGSMAQRSDRREQLTLPGRHSLRAYGQSIVVELRPGQTHMLWLDGWANVARRRPNSRQTAMVLAGVSGGAGAVGLGMGIGAAVVDSRGLRGTLGLGAAIAGAVAFGTGLGAAITLRRGTQSERSAARRKTVCSETARDPGPPSPP